MDFRTVYLQSVTINKITNLDFSPEQLIQHCYSYEKIHAYINKENFLHCLAGGNVQCGQVFSFSVQGGLPCGMLLYTKKGMGTLRCHGGHIELKEDQVVLFDCTQSFTIQSTVLPWEFQICFLYGGNLVVFLSMLHAEKGTVFDISMISSLPKTLQLILCSPEVLNYGDFMEMQMMLNEILSKLFLSMYQKSKKIPVNVPSYLIDFKDHLDHHYADPFLLEDYQEYYGINKYRICREFSKYFREPPLRYLNHVRINKAKEMLLNTELTVHEISSKIGYENVNHFINLFKRDTGMTPNVFKQEVLADQPVLHSRVQ